MPPVAPPLPDEWAATAPAQPISPPSAAPSSAPPSGGWAQPATAAPLAPEPADSAYEAESNGITAPVPEQAAFSGYYPREAALQVWQPLLVFIALDTARATAEVAAIAAERLRRPADDYRSARVPSQAPLERGARLTIVPQIAGFRCDPASVRAEWTDDVQCYAFRVRAERALPGQTAAGAIQIFEGPLLRGEIPVAILVRESRQRLATGDGAFADARVSAYRNTFPSYSRQDEPIVRAFEAVMEAGGDRFLRDVRTLRAGEDWAPALLDAIERADVFQLFWSPAAARSPQVEREWRHALALLPARPQFIRPVYWSAHPHPVPPELSPINFGRLDPALLGIARPSLVARWLGRRG